MKNDEVILKEEAEEEDGAVGETGDAPDQQEKKMISVPILENMDDLLLGHYKGMILRTLNQKLADGDLNAAVGKRITSRQIREDDCFFRRFDYWRLNQTDLYADLELRLQLNVETRQGEDTDFIWFCVTIWFSFADDDWDCCVEGIDLVENKPDRSGMWKLDRYLVPVLRRDEIDASAEEMWEHLSPEAKEEPRLRSPQDLVERLKLKVVRVPLYKCDGIRSTLFLRDSTILTQPERLPGEKESPPPVEEEIPARTIVVNTAASSRCSDLDVYHECIHYCWHFLFYCLQDMYSSSIRQIRTRKVRIKEDSKYANPLGFMEQQAEYGSFGLMMPVSFMRKTIETLYREMSSVARKSGYYDHDGFRYDAVGREIAQEYNLPKGLVRARMLQLGYSAAKGALNYVDNRYITPFAYSESMCSKGNTTYVIGHDMVAKLYSKEEGFRRIMQTGLFACVDGHVVYCDSSNVITNDGRARLSAWANAHIDRVSLRFTREYSSNGFTYTFGQFNSEQAWKDSLMFLDRSGSMCEQEAQRAKEKLMEEMPISFHGALTYIMKGRVSVDDLVRRIPISRSTILRLRTKERKQYKLDQVVAICIGLHLPPWMSEILLDKAGLSVKRYGPKGYYGTILDCCYMDTIEEIQEFLKKNGYEPLDLHPDE